MKKIITCVLAMLGLTTACGRQNYEDTDVQGFAELIANPDVVLLDVRTAEEFAEGHIAGALNMDQAQSDFIEKFFGCIPDMCLWHFLKPEEHTNQVNCSR